MKENIQNMESMDEMQQFIQIHNKFIIGDGCDAWNWDPNR